LTRDWILGKQRKRKENGAVGLGVLYPLSLKFGGYWAELLLFSSGV